MMSLKLEALTTPLLNVIMDMSLPVD